MRFISKQIKPHPDTFGPELHVTVAIPLEYIMDKAATNTTVEDVEKAIAADFIQLLKDNAELVNKK